VNRLLKLLRDEAGATAAEFALVLPVALLFLFGILDTGRYMWEVNQLEKAAQMGARYAVVTNVVATGLNTADFSGITCSDGSKIGTGSHICPEALGKVTCSAASGTLQCSCEATSVGAASCPALGTADAAQFRRIISRVRRFAPDVSDGQVIVRYQGSGLGFDGDASFSTYSTKNNSIPLADVSPLVTVEFNKPTFRSLLLLGGQIALPKINYTLTMEDGDGTIGY